MSILTEFILFADNFPIETVVDEINIPVSEKIKKGEVLLIGQEKNIPKVQNTTSITYSTGYIETIDVRESIRKIYDLLFPRKDIIIKQIKKYNINAKFCIVINLTDNPIIDLPYNFVKLASDLQADIEFDTYINIDDKTN